MGVTENFIVQISELEEQLAEKDAMIDWLIEKLHNCCTGRNCPQIPQLFKWEICKQCWRKAVQEAVRKNDNV